MLHCLPSCSNNAGGGKRKNNICIWNSLSISMCAYLLRAMCVFGDRVRLFVCESSVRYWKNASMSILPSLLCTNSVSCQWSRKLHWHDTNIPIFPCVIRKRHQEMRNIRRRSTTITNRVHSDPALRSSPPVSLLPKGGKRGERRGGVLISRRTHRQ